MKLLNLIIHRLLLKKVVIRKWQLHFFAVFFFSAGIAFGLTYLTSEIVIPRIFAAISPWSQTDWSGGTASGTVNGTVTTYESASNIVVSESGQLSLTKTFFSATLKGTQLSTDSTNFNVASKTALKFNTSQNYDDDYFSYSAGSPTRLTVDEAGDYLLSMTIPIDSDGGEDSANRNALEAEVRVNGTKVDAGLARSTYIRNYETHNESSGHLTVFLNDLSANDYIEIFVQGATNETAHNLTGTFTLYTEYIPDSETIFSATGTRTVSSTNLNGSASAMQWTEVQKDSGYTHSDATNSHEITLDAAGSYFVSVNIPLGSATQRANIVGRVLLDGSQVDGGEFSQGYIRNASAHADGSVHWNGVVTSASADQVLTITTEQESAGGTVTVDGEKGTIFIQKLPSTGVYVGESTTVAGSSNWNPGSESSINWTTDEIIDTDVYTHSTSVNSEQITVEQDGDYVLAFNVGYTSSTTRVGPEVSVLVNDADVTGAVTRTGYIRAASGHDESSSTMYVPLDGLSSGDVIKVNSVAIGNSGTVDDTDEALLMIWRKGYAATGTLTSNVFDAEFAADWGTMTFSSSGSGTVMMKVRSDSSSDMSGATAWSSCDAVASGADLSSNNCVTDTDQYLQYQITLEPSGSSTPVVEDLSIAFTASDQIAPTTNATNVAITGVDDGDWTNSEPTLTWTAGADNVGGGGLAGYCLALDEVDPGSSDSVDPALSADKLTGLDDGISVDDCPYIVSGTSVNLSTIDGLTLTSGKQYYVSMKAIDIAGNIWTGDSGDYQDLVSFKYDNVKPGNPSFLSMPSDFIATKEATITWPTTGANAASDSHSGVVGLQYRIGAGGTWYGDNHTGDQDADDLLTNDGSYTTQETPDFAAIEEGNNLIYFRTWDNAGNYSTTYVSGVLKVNSVAPGVPQNLGVTPDDAETNAYAFSWDAPSSFTGSEENLTYCYTVNTAPTANTCTYTSAGQTSLSEGAYATQPGTNTMYVVAKDEAGNINYDTYATVEFEYSGSAPGIPGNMDIADISIKATSNWKLALSWDEPSDTGAGIANYKVYRSTTSTSCSSGFSSFTEIGETSGSSYTDTGLSQTDYYYCAKACDSANNCGAVSSTVTAYPDGKFTAAASLTSGPAVSNITTKKATITWGTDRDSDSKIAFGTASGNYNEEEVSNSTQTTDHTINLTNLKAGTTYYYKAKWTDEDGNTGESEEKSFSTDAAPVIKDVEVQNISINSAIIQFTATGATKAQIYYGPTTTFGGLSEIATSTVETTYTVQLSGLDDDTEYFFKINAFDSEEEEYEGTILDFTTLPRPRISNVLIQEVKQAANPTVLVTWDTNTDISSVLTYYPEGNPSAARDEVDVARISGTHRMLLKGLSNNTRYAMVVKGIDKAGNEAESEVLNFTTATDTRPPLISNLTVEGSLSVGQIEGENKTVQLIVSWDTDEPSTSQVEFGEGTGTSYSQQTQEDKNLTFNHVVIIPGLTPQKVYHLRAISKDKQGNSGRSIDTVTITPRVTDDALDLVLTNLRETFGFLDAILK